VVRYLWLLLLGEGPRAELSACVLFWAVLSADPWLMGGFHCGWVRVAWWSLALFLDYLGGALDFATPVLGRAAGWHKIAERVHRLPRYGPERQACLETPTPTCGSACEPLV